MAFVWDTENAHVCFVVNVTFPLASHSRLLRARNDLSKMTKRKVLFKKLWYEWPDLIWSFLSNVLAYNADIRTGSWAARRPSYFPDRIKTTNPERKSSCVYLKWSRVPVSLFPVLFPPLFSAKPVIMRVNVKCRLGWLQLWTMERRHKMAEEPDRKCKSACAYEPQSAQKKQDLKMLLTTALYTK